MSNSSVTSSLTAPDLGDGPLMTKSSPTSSNNTPKMPSSDRSRKPHKDDDRANWINGKRPKGYRTPEGREAAEKSKHYKSGTTIPHLVYPCDTYEGVLRHAVLGAIRSAGVSYGAKALVNLCLGMLKVMKGKVSFAKVLKDSFAGQDAIRFGSFFGTFSFLWKLVNNGLKLYRGTDDRVNGAIAGAIAGLSILIENHERRKTFAQQMFIRSMQGVYHAGKHRGQFSFRHGDALLFAFASAQVMYAYTMHPDTIPKEFFGFMVKTARVPAEALAINRNMVRGFPLDLKQVRAMIDRHRPTKLAIETVSNMSENASVLPCAALHPWIDSCKKNNVERFVQVTKEIFPVYATLNFVPLLVLRMKRLAKDPINVVSKTTFNTLRSSVFLAIFVAGYQTQICTHRNLLLAGLPLGNSKYLYWFIGLVCAGVSIMVEQESRRAELAMYVLPKAAESLYKILYNKKLVKGVKHWDVMMFSFAMSIIMSFYQKEQQVLSPFVTRLIYHVLGRS
ncbi:hypothetical protein BGZ80_005522 [Entomortierella chlamydospora]|uniref:Transmembrane protein 135 N-terminal domain-containing protein n=1 Tax=Entomortierella chlamydospora TaxID=101097 RepID=A0A9P6N026_9FUNG|nr:hypothetical protein BGZ79_007761 [Entomortierella chlamydospora]KAG0019628.1 hypothetical protein BGZ80_005522 [Entomortierella chlamydospora]